MNCGTGMQACLDPNGQKPMCTNTLYDSRNCGACGMVCANGACMNGVCMVNTSTDAGAVMADGGAPAPGGCNGMAPNVCPGPAGSSYCADLVRGVSDCGMCGQGCSGGLVCMGGLCVDPPATGGGSCGGNLQMCPSGCTSLQDDSRNCGACGQLCQGSCNSGQCQPLGQRAFGSTCSRNGDCQGGLCMDMMRFGWPGGFCTSVCDVDLPCAAGQTCVGSPASGAFGSCRPSCVGDADCRAGFFCVQNACQPDCRQGPVCANGQMCDATGRCVTQVQQSCTQPQVTCPTPGGAGTYCTDPAKDPNNCGACGRVCPSGTVCNGGVCGAQTCGAPATACPVATGSICADLQHDAQNCGGCGHVCANNAICTNGVCQGGGGSYPGVAACAGACTSLLNDPKNCGACGTVCAQGLGCYNGTCGTAPPPPVCPAGNNVCTDPMGQKMYCSDPMFDPNNCGGCGKACAMGMSCQMGACTASTATDGGVTPTCLAPSKQCFNAMGSFCADVQNDGANCGGCGNQCQAGTFCKMGQCMTTGGTDGGATADGGAISCAAGTQACYPATAPAFCANTGFDANNCGGCFKPCPGGWVCQQGTCLPPPTDGGTDASISCQAGYSICDGTYCADLLSDHDNCGGCHLACAPLNEACSNGACVIIPMAPQ
jgi:hypothetical protein